MHPAVTTAYTKQMARFRKRTTVRQERNTVKCVFHIHSQHRKPSYLPPHVMSKLLLGTCSTNPCNVRVQIKESWSVRGC